MSIYKYGADYVKDLEVRRQVSREMLRSFIKCAELIIVLGGEISFEWPKSCLGWYQDDLTEFEDSREVVEMLAEEYKACESPDYIKWTYDQPGGVGTMPSATGTVVDPRMVR